MSALKNFKVNVWYIGLVVVAAFILAAALAAGNSAAAIIATGFLLVGFGEWINHPPKTRIGPRYKFTASERDPSIFGWIMNLIGGSVVVFGVIRLFFQ